MKPSRVFVYAQKDISHTVGEAQKKTHVMRVTTLDWKILLHVLFKPSRNTSWTAVFHIHNAISATN